MRISTIRRLGLLAFAAAFAPSAPSLAADVWSGCYQKVYDAPHMAAHRGQTVTSLTVQLTPMKPEPPWASSASLTFTLKGHTAKYLDGGDCSTAKDGLFCGMDEDAGALTLARSGADLVVTITQDMRLDRAGQASDESTGPLIKASNREDRTFLLHPVAAGVCK
jgi:hypothetical protein